MQDFETKARELLNDLFKADNRYGCGFYNDTEWREAYGKLQRLVNFSGSTAMLGDGETIDSLPDPYA